MSGGAAVAAAAARRRTLLEEEQMTTYGSDDLGHDWEFKIVRANTPVFRNPEHLNRLLEEEAQAGWTMVEKFDNSRIRFKRPRGVRLNDSTLPPGIDPYRVQYGMSPVAFTALLVLTMLGLSGALMFLVFLVVRATVP
jgi:hypothetical protein